MVTNYITNEHEEDQTGCPTTEKICLYLAAEVKREKIYSIHLNCWILKRTSGLMVMGYSLNPCGTSS